MSDSVHDEMRRDWDRRAREDAGYYVAFGRRRQSDEEFFATASDVVRALTAELKRLPPAAPGARRALEIGCGPGRLMRPLAAHFGEIHGVDISEEMIRRARENLAGIPHAHVQVAPRSDLAAFAGDSFDFVYSYAVFQHIPSHAVVWRYLDEARRVLKPGGVLRCQINGLPETARRFDTWSGVRIPAAEVARFARDQGLALLALEGAGTQYMWVTCRKPAGPAAPPSGGTRIRRVTNAHSSEPLAPVRGRFASISLWVENLPPEADLNSVEVRVGGRIAFASYLGPQEQDGLQQLNAYLPEGLPTGLQPVELAHGGATLAAPVQIRLIAPPPSVPRIVSVTDGIDLCGGTRISTRSVKVTIEECARPEEFSAAVDGLPVEDAEHFCVDPRLPAWEINFRLPEAIGAGRHELICRLGRRAFAPAGIDVEPSQ
jgi:SAM-dependent methyltransferase